MEGRLVEERDSQTAQQPVESGVTAPKVEEISDQELQAILREARRELLHPRSQRRLEVTVRILMRFVCDASAMWAALVFSYWVRFQYPLVVRLFPPENAVSFGPVALTLAMTSPVLFLALKACGMYDPYQRIRVLDRIPRIVGSVNAHLVFTLIVSFLFNSLATPRGFLVFFWASSIIFIFVSRTFLQFLASLIGWGDVVMRNTLIIGAGRVGKSVARKLIKHQGFGLRPIGFLDDDPLFAEFEEPELRDLRVLGNLDSLENVIRDFRVEKVIIAFNTSPAERLLDLASTCNGAGVECSIVPRLFEVITDEITVNEIGGIPLIRLRDKRLHGYKKALKTLEDYVLGTAILLVIWPILLVTAIAIKLDSPGPVFFRHRRVGKDGKCFDCLKFRSMVDGAHKMQAELVNGKSGNEFGWLCWKEKEDPRVTRVGKWIRKFSIDELPQIFNVLAGQMSLVGPRPHIKEEVRQYKDWHRQRLNVKPGITGLWQVSGRSDLPFDEMIKLDLYYIETWSLWQDIKIILRTFKAIITGDGAY
ncbi:sugar transferase [Candidatus Solincola tengchongensis]|uniref:sugar transferase n=1 Tax=Candidatus Solincola tengchongensis TaxID=2900693 RepID=UPI00257B1EB1|nr:sugar transferase [Candidatus Solincola tengchongensis]